MGTLIKDLRSSELGANEWIAECLRAIAALGYQSLEQFAGAARVARPAFEAYLQTDIDALLQALPRPEPLDTTTFTAITETSFGAGAELSLIPRVLPAPAVFTSAEELPDKIDMTDEMPEVRNQNPRGTCVAHATLAVFEHYLGKRLGKIPDMSEQFLIFLCKEGDDHQEHEGSTLGIAFSMLGLIGCCLEQTWQYNHTPNPCNWGQGPPPDAARPEAANFTSPATQLIAPRRVVDIKTVLASDRCVAFTIPAFRSWFCNDEVKASGNIILPAPGEKPINGHSMCMVGYRDIPDTPDLDLGGGVFLIRNSWGDRWGVTSPVPGYGTIPYRFIECFGLEAYTIDTSAV